MKFFKDLQVLYVRNIIGSLRNPVWLFIGLFQPVLYLLALRAAPEQPRQRSGLSAGGAYTVFTPGLLVMIALFGTAFAGFGLVDHIRNGFVERLLVTPAQPARHPSCLSHAGCQRPGWCSQPARRGAGRGPGPDGELPRAPGRLRPHGPHRHPDGLLLLLRWRCF